MLALLSSGSKTTTVVLLVKPISPLAMSGVMDNVRLSGPPNLGLFEGIGVLMSSSSSLVN